MCQGVPESIIFLSCDYISAWSARENLFFRRPIYARSIFSEVGCGLCGETTELSKEVQETQIEFLNSVEFEIEKDQDDNPEEEDQDEDVEQEDRKTKWRKKKKMRMTKQNRSR